MSFMEQQDAAAMLDDWTNRVANLPNEIAFTYDEMEEKDRQIAECLAIISKHDNTLQNWVRKNGGHVPHPKESVLNKIILDTFTRAQTLQAEKLVIAQKCQQIVDKHTRNLDIHIKALRERGEFTNDTELPSMLRDVPAPLISRVKTSAVTVATPYTPTAAAATAVTVPHVRASQDSHTTTPQQNHPLQSSIPTSKASIPSIATSGGRQARDLSTTSAIKRQYLVGSVNSQVSNGPSNQASLAPSASNVPSPAPAARVSYTGPRTHVRIGPKKFMSHGGKPAGFGRRFKKNGSSRVKRTGSRTSPSPTHDSELSGAESGSIHEEDEDHTPRHYQNSAVHEAIVDIEDDDGGDDRKYCTCQSISYGDMVACDNPKCEFEWFHWSCVGLKSEPLGTWICATCKATGFRK